MPARAQAGSSVPVQGNTITLSLLFIGFFFTLKAFQSCPGFSHKICSNSNLFWSGSPPKSLYFKFLFSFPIKSIHLFVGEYCEGQAVLKPTSFSWGLYQHWTPARGWGNGRLKAEGRTEDLGEIGWHWKSKREYRALWNGLPTLITGRCRRKQCCYPTPHREPKTQRIYFALRAVSSPCISELLCGFGADPWVSPCWRGWGWLGSPGRCLHLPLLPPCILCFLPERFRSKWANLLRFPGLNSLDCCY